MRKEAIHHPNTAQGNPDTALIHTLHAVIQIAAGHYHVLGAHQHPVSPGVDYLGFLRAHTASNALAHDPDTTFANKLLAQIKQHIAQQ